MPQNAAVDHTSEFVQYVADNVDHNIRTLDANDTFHAMGIIYLDTQGAKHSQFVPRKKVNPDDTSTTGRIQIQQKGLVNQEIEIKYNSIAIE